MEIDDESLRIPTPRGPLFLYSHSNVTVARLRRYHTQCDTRLEATLRLYRDRQELDRCSRLRLGRSPLNLPRSELPRTSVSSQIAAVEAQQWKLLRESSDIRVYRLKTRQERTCTVQAMGTVHGPLEDVMNGLYADSTRTARVLEMLLSPRSLDARVLQVDKRSTEIKPFQFSGIVWMALKLSGLGLCRHRDFLCFKKMDLIKDDMGESHGQRRFILNFLAQRSRKTANHAYVLIASRGCCRSLCLCRCVFNKIEFDIRASAPAHQHDPLRFLRDGTEATEEERTFDLSELREPLLAANDVEKNPNFKKLHNVLIYFKHDTTGDNLLMYSKFQQWVEVMKKQHSIWSNVSIVKLLGHFYNDHELLPMLEKSVGRSEEDAWNCMENAMASYYENDDLCGVVADTLSRPTVSGAHHNEPAVPTSLIPEMPHVVHECTDDCILHFTFLDKHMVHSALIQYIPLDVSQLLLDDVKLRGESRPIVVAQEQIHNAEFHVVRAHISTEVRKAIQQGYCKDKFFKNIWKTKQSNNNFIIDKGFIYLKQDDPIQQICIPDMPELKTKILYEFHDAATAARP